MSDWMIWAIFIAQYFVVLWLVWKQLCRYTKYKRRGQFWRDAINEIEGWMFLPIVNIVGLVIITIAILDTYDWFKQLTVKKL